MKQRKSSGARFAVCIDNSGYPASLEVHKIYQVIPDEHAAEEGDLRVIDESGEDYLYPASSFMMKPGEEEIVGRRLKEILSAAAKRQRA